MKLAALMAVALISSMLTGTLYAHGKKEHDDTSTNATTEEVVDKEQTDWGVAADNSDSLRIIEVTMADSMRFTPENFAVSMGESVRFVIHNKGNLLHEFVLGTKETLDEHAALMVKFPNMEHDEPYMAHVGPGEKGEIRWTFNRAGTIDFACLIAGHYQAGMVGEILVQ